MKKILILFVTIFVLSFNGFESKASYNYTEFGGIESSEPMKVKKILDSNTLVDKDGNKIQINILKDGALAKTGVGEIADIAKCENLLYLLDKANNAIIVLNENYVVENIYDVSNSSKMSQSGTTYDDNLRLHSPEGIYVIKDGNRHKIFVADTEYVHLDADGNNILMEGTEQSETGRVMVFLRTQNGNIAKQKLEFTKPDDPAIKGKQFKPSKITVDKEGRVYCIAKNVYEGIIDFNPDGSFNRFFGNNKVSSLGFWSIFYSKEQRKKLATKLQSVFNNLIIDNKNFIFTVSKETETLFVQRLNYQGSNILKENGMVKVKGDVSWQWQYEDIPTGASNFVDIDYNENGYFSVLDNKRSRVFTYDLEGNLLYIFGQKGELQTSSQNAAALSYFNEEILVSDTTNNNIIVYEPTDFGSKINEAVSLQNKGLYDDAKVLWEEILTINSNCLSLLTVSPLSLISVSIERLSIIL